VERANDLGMSAGHDPAFSKKMAERGWVGMSVPRHYGGPARPAVDRFIVVEEMLRSGAPVGAHWVSHRQTAPTILKIRPDDSEMLNYLGYSWIDRGEHLPEALAMVQRAVASNPKSGAMIDSLGWAYYRLGDYKKAVEKLEEAVELEAGDPDINNHLGDAYWRIGRRAEAEFQWKRVLTLDPEAKMKTEVEAKLASGLGPSGPAQTPRVAGQ